MGKAKILAPVLLLLVFSFVYAVFVSLSENRKYGRLSVDHLLLTPGAIAGIAGFCLDEPRFSYSAADGPKPVVSSVECAMDQAKVLGYLRDNRFQKSAGDSYKRDKDIVEILQDQPDRIRKVTLLEFL